MVSFFVILLLLGINSVNALPFRITLTANILLGVSALIGVVSAVIYLKEGLKKISFTK